MQGFTHTGFTHKGDMHCGFSFRASAARVRCALPRLAVHDVAACRSCAHFSLWLLIKSVIVPKVSEKFTVKCRAEPRQRSCSNDGPANTRENTQFSKLILTSSAAWTRVRHSFDFRVDCFAICFILNRKLFWSCVFLAPSATACRKSGSYGKC